MAFLITTIINKLVGFITPKFDKNLAPIRIRVQNKESRFKK